MKGGFHSLLAAGVLVLVASMPVVAADSDGDGLRDSFEIHRSLTDPNAWDSDADGVIDSAEDSDGDRLSNLGEQRFKTNPLKRDSNGNGRSDGNEDSNHNGISNALEQDRRPLPAGLHPTLTHAVKDFPEGRWECQTRHRKTKVLPCKTGDVASSLRVVIFGDSHAAQWVPSLSLAGKKEGWQIVQLTKTGCPSIGATVLSQYRIDAGRTCRRWRLNAFKWLRRHPPNVIIITNRSRWTLVEHGRVVPNSRRARSWRRAMARTLAALPKTSTVIVLRDTPAMNGEPVQCLASHRTNMAACETRRGRALSNPIMRAERQAATAAGATTRTLNAKICPYDPCPLVQGNRLIWRDHGHLTATFSRRLWPSMRNLIVAVAGHDLGSGSATAAASIALAGRLPVSGSALASNAASVFFNGVPIAFNGVPIAYNGVPIFFNDVPGS